jgi:hypothetical protein
MSAAANAAGYLFAQGKLAMDQAKPQKVAKSQPTSVPTQGDSQTAKQVRTTRVEYRKRRAYALPAAA